MLNIKISKDFSDTPGPRYIKDGEYSGEAFRKELLEPLFREAIEKQEKLLIDFDGGYGYPTSFLEEAFGGLVRSYSKEQVKNILRYVSTEEPALILAVEELINKAK